MKKLIIKMGSGLVDFCAYLFLFGIIFLSIVTMITNNFVQGLVILVAGTLLLVCIFYTIYLLISIHDNLKEINEKLTNK